MQRKDSQNHHDQCRCSFHHYDPPIELSQAPMEWSRHSLVATTDTLTSVPVHHDTPGITGTTQRPCLFRSGRR